MQLHELKPSHKQKKKKRIGRGGKRGTYSGRGLKGQKSRAGRRLPPAIREVIKRYPKLRGYKFKSQTQSQTSRTSILNVEILEKKFNSGDKVSAETLLEKRLISRIKGRMPVVKILGNGKLTKALNIEGCFFSKKAKELIEKAGGTISR
ncbi:MAG: uL15m family ribosomal protein [bacterium]|nr:uL15m family ribosomal protein [bacterium]